MENNLKNESSPYLLQHKNNPVNWYPWGSEAFSKAKKENKPIFLSIGYSTCHWCHVMAHESFEDPEVAEILNENFISIKVDKEERPDVDSIYMSVCQMFTGNGGWPMSIFMDSLQKPFYAGTYFPKDHFKTLLLEIINIWQTDKEELTLMGNKIISQLNLTTESKGKISESLINKALLQFENSFDSICGGFGGAPKFPSAHNLMFLTNLYENTKDKNILDMIEKTLLQMYKGGLFDHIGFGFSRYSTDKYFLVPHFEKMLYDNALLIMIYIKIFDITQNEIYKDICVKTAHYILREMTSPDGGFYSAQDADSEGKEGKYYTFSYKEILDILGEDVGKEFNKYYSITENGNFEGENIPNLLFNNDINNKYEKYLDTIYEYRKNRYNLHLDDKILTSWNCLMISAFTMIHRVLEDDIYLKSAKRSYEFLNENLWDNNALHVSFRNGKLGSKGFLDDYALYIYASLNLYETTFDEKYLNKALERCNMVIDEFYDNKNSGFYLYSENNEKLILKPKEIYDGAIPSGNSIMAYNLVKLSQITENEKLEKICKEQLEFLASNAKDYPSGHSFYLLALSMYINPPIHIVCVLKDIHEKFPLDSIVKIVDENNSEYKIINNKTTYYVCKNKNCLPPTNTLEGII